MAEVDYESRHVWSHKQRIAIFLSGMRHFRDALLAEDIRVKYTCLLYTSPSPRDRTRSRMPSSA